ncbi:nucleotidyltransferase domain-containing protein [Geomonas nitrogeniifigens]|uniref:Nucleotidyltransferase domain-containing protein n=1 Tax=Geomonas diazotrophica TaxID=2843197 RepID=A0ABX8JPR8_9BACT|nr:GSU2403 family nucleotidyltransferase fold protein [Geomonas nitrogeniifigens]QWV99689.1 nucleotidyltransferase domain-containing protein [Geomonas nitrogeniifigens]
MHQKTEESLIAFIYNVGPARTRVMKVRDDQRYTAVNSKGFEIDVIRPVIAADDDPRWKASRMSDEDDDIMAVKAPTGKILQGARPFNAMVVSSNGFMARMFTVEPMEFVRVKKWLAQQPDPDPMKRSRDHLQAELVQEMVREYLPHLAD